MESPLNNAALQGGLLDLATLASQKGVKERGAYGLPRSGNIECGKVYPNSIWDTFHMKIPEVLLMEEILHPTFMKPCN